MNLSAIFGDGGSDNGLPVMVLEALATKMMKDLVVARRMNDLIGKEGNICVTCKEEGDLCLGCGRCDACHELEVNVEDEFILEMKRHSAVLVAEIVLSYYLGIRSHREELGTEVFLAAAEVIADESEENVERFIATTEKSMMSSDDDEDDGLSDEFKEFMSELFG